MIGGFAVLGSDLKLELAQGRRNRCPADLGLGIVVERSLTYRKFADRGEPNDVVRQTELDPLWRDEVVECEGDEDLLLIDLLDFDVAVCGRNIGAANQRVVGGRIAACDHGKHEQRD